VKCRNTDEDLLAMLLQDNYKDMLDKIISAFSDGSDDKTDDDDDNEENPAL
jgi:hypothetical protein